MTTPSYMKRDDIRGIYPVELNGTVAEALGRAVCQLLKEQGIPAPVVAVGHDCRHGNLEIAQGFALGVVREGGSCTDLGLVSTEHVYFACGVHGDRYSAGAMVTASHNPREYNGLKLIHSGCAPFGAEDLAFVGRRTQELLANTRHTLDFEEYADHVMRLSGFDSWADSDAPSFKLVVLAGNGMGAFAFRPVLKRLEAKGLRTVILEGEPDGDFPQGVPNPLLPEFMARLGKQVLAQGADLGIGFDGDADRAGFVDASGAEIIPSQVLALIADRKLKGSTLERPVVMRNLCCSQLLVHLLSTRATLVDTPVGHGKIKLLMRSDAYRDRTLFAGEHSGHYFYPEYSYVDSGVLTALNMLAIAWELKKQSPDALVRRLSQWRANYCWSGEQNYQLETTAQTRQALLAVCAAQSAPGVTRYEGRLDEALGGLQRIFPSTGEYQPQALPAPDLKMVWDQGDHGWWFVLRPSGNEPKLRLNVEAWGPDAARDCQAKTAELHALIQSCRS